MLGLVTYKHGAPNGACSKPYSTENREEPFLALACRSWRETKTKGITGELPRRRGRTVVTGKAAIGDRPGLRLGKDRERRRRATPALSPALEVDRIGIEVNRAIS